MKKIVCICIVLAALICMFVSCTNEEYEPASISLKDKCEVAFNYLKNTDFSFYNIEEYEYKSAKYAELFDEGTIYKITIYVNSYTEISERIYYLGKLDGEDILYRADYYNYSSYGCKYKLVECDL